MAAHYLEFERPIADLEAKIEELSKLSETAKPGAFDDEIARLLRCVGHRRADPVTGMRLAGFAPC